MGVEFEVVLYAPEAAKAAEALTKAMARIAALDKRLSDYDPESELSKLSETSVVSGPAPAEFPWVKLSDDLWTALNEAQHISRASGGAFDVTIGPLTKGVAASAAVEGAAGEGNVGRGKGGGRLSESPARRGGRMRPGS